MRVLRISILCFNRKINLVTIVTVLGPDDKVRQFNWTQFVCQAVPRSHGSLLSPLLYLCIVSVNGSNCALMSPARLCRVEHGVETGESKFIYSEFNAIFKHFAKVFKSIFNLKLDLSSYTELYFNAYFTHLNS